MSKSVKNAKSKNKSLIEQNSVLFAMGYFDIILKIKFTDEDLLKSSEVSENPESDEKPEASTQKDNYYHIEDLNSIEDLNFLKNKKELWDKIILSGGNDTLKQLIIGNRISKKKCKIEYFSFNRPLFIDNQEFFSEIFDYVCTKNNIYISDTPLESSARFSLRIVLQHKLEINEIFIGYSYENEEKERIKKKILKQRQQDLVNDYKNEEKNNENNMSDNEEEKNNNEKENNVYDDEESDEDEYRLYYDVNNYKGHEYTDTEAIELKKIPKFKRSSTILLKLEPICDKYSLAYINYNDMKRVPGDFKMHDLVELLDFFKSKGTTIFINFYKPKKPLIQIDEETLETHEDDNEIMEEGKTPTAPKEEVEEINDENVELNKDGPSFKMIELNNLYDINNIFFFDMKQCKRIFNKHYEAFTEDNINNRKKITRSKIFDYFIKGIAPATKEEVYGMKTGLFLDQLHRLSIIYTSKKAANKQEFDCQPYPKINHNNMNLIKRYKDLIESKKNDYYSIFIAPIIIYCAIKAPNCQSTDVLYPSFIISLEVIKKKVELEKNNLMSDENSIYKVKLDEKKILKTLEILSSGGKENGFILDCTNKQKSTMKDYVSLYDYHLKTFFSSEMIQKNLKNKGFINSEGYIMYDPMYKNSMNVKAKKKINEKELNNKILNSINGINVPSNIKDKEIDAEKAAKGKNLPTKSKLPINKDYIMYMEKEKKRKRKKKNEIGGSSIDSDGGSASGKDSNA